MARRNRSGPWTPRPGIRLEREYVFDALARGAQVVDVRSSAAYAAGHLRGTLAIPAGAQCAVYAGWVTPWGAELVFLSDSDDVLEAVESELASIGIEGVSTSLLPRRRRRATGPSCAVRTGPGSPPRLRHRTPSSWTYDARTSGAPGTSPTR